MFHNTSIRKSQVLSSPTQKHTPSSGYRPIRSPHITSNANSLTDQYEALQQDPPVHVLSVDPAWNQLLDPTVPGTAEQDASFISVRSPDMVFPDTIACNAHFQRTDLFCENSTRCLHIDNASIEQGIRPRIFACPYPDCSSKSFGWRYELQRHIAGLHEAKRPVFWCTVAGCGRSEMEGEIPFPRKDNTNDYIRKVHKM